MTGKRRQRGRRGFTLVELLVSLVVLALISTALFTALRFSARSWRAGESRLVAASDEDAVRRFLRMRLAEAMPVAMPAGDRARDRAREMVFRGDAAHLRFAAPMPHALGLGGIYVFSLSPGERAPLMLDWLLLRPDRLLDVADGRERPRPLFATGIRAVRFRYFGSIDGRNEPEWTEIWESGDLPRLVEIRFEAKEGRTPPPPIRVAIAAAS